MWSLITSKSIISFQPPLVLYCKKQFQESYTVTALQRCSESLQICFKSRACQGASSFFLHDVINWHAYSLPEITQWMPTAWHPTDRRKESLLPSCSFPVMRTIFYWNMEPFNRTLLQLPPLPSLSCFVIWTIIKINQFEAGPLLVFDHICYSTEIQTALVKKACVGGIGLCLHWEWNLSDRYNGWLWTRWWWR